MDDVSHTATSDDIKTVRRMLLRGDIPFSTKIPVVVGAVRALAAQKLTSAEISHELGLGGNKSQMISFCRRAKIPLQYPQGVHRIKEDRERNFSVRRSRTASAPAPAPVWLLPTNVPYRSAAGQRIAKRHRMTPRCMWAGCSEDPVAPGKPYCWAHMKANGAVT